MMVWLSVAAAVAIAFLARSLFTRLSSDRIGEMNDRRRKTSLMVSRGEFVDGNRHLSVALALTDSTFFYENPDMEASLDLEWVREVEYDTELATGLAIETGKVLRLRCFSQMFEFVLPPGVVRQWELILPPHRMITTEA
jgi:hypothetical protein